MDAKLTLKLNETVIKKAEKYASNRNLSLSELIENYLELFTNEEEEKFEISPFVRNISTGNSIPNNIDGKELRKEYINYLDEKYQ